MLHFLHFIVVMPAVGLLEKTDPIPMSISEPVLSGGAEPSLAKKDNEILIRSNLGASDRRIEIYKEN